MGKSEIQIFEFSAFEPKPCTFTLILSSNPKALINKTCLTNPSTSYQKMALGRVLWTRQTQDLLFVLGSETNQLHPSISLDPVSKICKPPHTSDKGISGEEISQRDHGHNLKDLEPIRA